MRSPTTVTPSTNLKVLTGWMGGGGAVSEEGIKNSMIAEYTTLAFFDE